MADESWTASAVTLSSRFFSPYRCWNVMPKLEDICTALMHPHLVQHHLVGERRRTVAHKVAHQPPRGEEKHTMEAGTPDGDRDPARLRDPSRHSLGTPHLPAAPALLLMECCICSLLLRSSYRRSRRRFFSDSELRQQGAHTRDVQVSSGFCTHTWQRQRSEQLLYERASAGLGTGSASACRGMRRMPGARGWERRDATQLRNNWGVSPQWVVKGRCVGTHPC